MGAEELDAIVMHSYIIPYFITDAERIEKLLAVQYAEYFAKPARVEPRPKQTNCQQEPPYPLHETVVFALSAPEMTCHLATVRCVIEHPHAITECGEFEPSV